MQSVNECYCFFFMTSGVMLSKSNDSDVQPSFCRTLVAGIWLSGNGLGI